MNNSEKRCGCEHIKGIRCAAKNCVHHDGDCYCTANEISVAPASATCSSETACATFKLNSDCTCH